MTELQPVRIMVQGGTQRILPATAWKMLESYMSKRARRLPTDNEVDMIMSRWQAMEDSKSNSASAYAKYGVGVPEMMTLKTINGGDSVKEEKDCESCYYFRASDWGMRCKEPVHVATGNTTCNNNEMWMPKSTSGSSASNAIRPLTEVLC